MSPQTQESFPGVSPGLPLESPYFSAKSYIEFQGSWRGRVTNLVLALLGYASEQRNAFILTFLTAKARTGGLGPLSVVALRILSVRKHFLFPDLNLGRHDWTGLIEAPGVLNHVLKSYANYVCRSPLVVSSSSTNSTRVDQIVLPEVRTILLKDVVVEATSGEVIIRDALGALSPYFVLSSGVGSYMRGSIYQEQNNINDPFRAFRKPCDLFANQFVVSVSALLRRYRNSQYHFFVEVLPYMLRISEAVQSFSERQVRFLCPQEIPRWMDPFLTHLPARLSVGNPSAFYLARSAVSPLHTVWPDPRAVESVRNFVFQTVMPKFKPLDPSPPTKILISRANSQRYSPTVAQLERACLDHGFSLIDPYKVPPQEMIWLMSHATHLAGAYGNNQHHIMWSAPGTCLIDLYSPEYWDRTYEALVTCIDGRVVRATPANIAQILTTI